jgi:hypothetical protein
MSARGIFELVLFRLTDFSPVDSVMQLCILGFQ